MELTEKELKAKERICLALDVPTVNDALNLVSELFDLIGYFKVGKELHCAACNEGIPIVEEINKRGGKVFLDLKFHDTPQTVYNACYSAVVPGVSLLNIHIAGGKDMCEKAMLAVKTKSNELNISVPKVIGVTELTSLDDNDLKDQHINISYDDLVIRRAKLAEEWRLDGIVCPANKTKEIQEKIGTPYLFVTPGIQWGGKHGVGQKQLFTPDQAVKDCKNSILVIGSAITKAQDKRDSTKKIIEVMIDFI